MLPPLIVLTVTGIKDGYENIRRHNSDNEINNQLTELVNSDSSTRNCKWRKLRPGDVVRLELNSGNGISFRKWKIRKNGRTIEMKFGRINFLPEKNN